MNTGTNTPGKCYVDNLCNGCQGCIGSSTCPFGAITFDTTTNTATIDQTKCIGYTECQSYNDGIQTFCEQSCPNPDSANIYSALAIRRA